jgi:PiT family inorganic phosphate transporter
MGLTPVLPLLAAVILVNGWTDAPNAIAAPVAAGVVSFRAAVVLAAGCNLLGVVCTAAVSDKVARTLYSIADFGPQALTALTAALAATALWGVAAWRLGIPTSESHALVSGLVGAALALGADRLELEALGRVALGLVLSLASGAALGRLFRRLLPQGKERLYRGGQVAGAACTAFLHGAQDGQKFLGVLALILTLDRGGYALPLWAPWACAGLMALGTLLGGGRIIETVGRKMVRLDPRSGFAAEVGSAAALAGCTLLGLPVSTTHVKTAAILGAGASPDKKVAGELGIAWLLTFPACGVLAFCLVKVLLLW